jgi:hypothetical protein
MASLFQIAELAASERGCMLILELCRLMLIHLKPFYALPLMRRCR